MMIATDKIRQDGDQRKNGKDPPKPDSSASWNDQIFKDRLLRFKKASGQTVPAQRLKQAKSKVTSGNKSNSSDRGNIQKTSTHKYNIQRELTEKYNIQRRLTEKCDIQRSLKEKCDIQRSLKDKCDIPRSFTDDVKAVKHGVHGPASVCSQAAELRRQLQNSHNRQRLLATLAFVEREKKEEECGYRLSSNGVLVSTRKTDVYKNVDLCAQNTRDEKSRVVLASGEFADECKTNTNHELEDEDDFDTDGDEKLTNDRLDSHCKEIHSKDYVYKVYNPVNLLPKGNKCTGEKCCKEISGSKVKVRYIFDSAEMECYDYCFGKTSFVPTDSIGSHKVKRIQSPKLPKCNTESVRKTQEDTEKEITVPDVVITEARVKSCAPEEEKIQATRKEWLEGVQERSVSAGGQQSIISANESSEDKEGPNFTCKLEMEYMPSISVLQEDKSLKEVTGILEMQNNRLQTELTKYGESKEDTSVFDHVDSKSVIETTECAEDSVTVCENSHKCAVKDNKELHTGNPELRNTLELQDGGEEHLEKEPDILSAKYENKNIRCTLGSKEVCGKIQTMHSTLESQLKDINKQETGSVLPQNYNANRKLTTGCSLLSHDAFDPQKAECNSTLQEDASNRQGMRFVLYNSDDDVGNNSTGSDVYGTKFVLMPDHSDVENRGGGCVSQQHKGFKDIDKGCVSSQQMYFEDNDDECVPKQHWGFDDNYAECVSRKQGNFQDNDFEYVSRQYGNFEDNGVEYVSRQHENFEDNGVQCVSRQLENFADNGVQCVSRQYENLEDNGVQCVSRQLENLEDNGVQCVSRQLENFADNGVECVSRQLEDLKDKGNECFSRQHGGFKNASFEFVSRHHDDIKDSNRNFKHSDVGTVSKQHGGFKDNDVPSQQGGLENNNTEGVDRRHGGVAGNYDVELVTGFQDCVEEYQNVEYISRPGIKFEVCLKEKRETVNKQHKDKGSDIKKGVEHDEVKHESTEKSTDRNNDIHKKSKTKCLLGNVVAADIGEIANHVQERNTEQEQYSQHGNISPVSRNEEYETASEDDTSKGDLVRELVCFNEYQSGDRKYASPYSKFQQCHDDLLKRLTDHWDDPFECENRELFSGCQYECSEHDKEETEGETKEEAEEETKEEAEEETNEETEEETKEETKEETNEETEEETKEETEEETKEETEEETEEETNEEDEEETNEETEEETKEETNEETEEESNEENEEESEEETKEETDKDIEQDPCYNVQSKKLNTLALGDNTAGCDIVYTDTFQTENVGDLKCNVLIQCVQGSKMELNVQSGNVKVQAGNVKAQEGNVKVQAGNVKVQAGNFKVQAGNVQAGNVKVQAGNVKVQAGNFKAQASNFKVQAGNLKVQAGNVEVQAGSVEVQAGNLKVQAGNHNIAIAVEHINVNTNQDVHIHSTNQDNADLTPEKSSIASASILEEASGSSIYSQYSTVNSRNDLTENMTSQVSSRSECYSRNNRHMISDGSPMYSPEIGDAFEFNCRMNAGDSDYISHTQCVVYDSREVFATSPYGCESFCNSMRPSKSQLSVPVRNRDLVNADGTYPKSAGYFPHCSEHSLAYESDYNKQDNGINLQHGAVINITDETTLGKTSTIELAILQESEPCSVNPIHVSEQMNLAPNDTFIGYLKENNSQERLYSVDKEINPAAGVKENCISPSTVSKTATESFTELDISCSSYCALGSNPASMEVLPDAGCVNAQAHTTVSLAPRNDIIEGITGINKAALCHADMHGHEISGENKDGRSGHNLGESKLAKTNLSVSKLSSDQALSNSTIYEQGGSGNDNYQNERINAAKQFQSLKIRKHKEDERLDQETSKEVINEHDLDFLNQKLENSPTNVAPWDFSTPSQPNRNNENDGRLGELLSVQRETCGIMMKNVLRRANKSKNLHKTAKTKPTVHAENISRSPLFCMVTGSKIEARIKHAPSKAIHRSKTQMACRGHKPIQQKQNQQVDLRGRRQTMWNSSNVSQVPENRRNLSKTCKQLSSKDYTERSKPVDNVNASEDKDKSTKTELQSKRKVRTDKTVQESKTTQENIKDKHSITKTTAGQEPDCKYSGQCNDKLTFSKIPRPAKTFILSGKRHQQGNKNTNYTGVSESLEQSNSEACDPSQSSSRALKSTCIYTDSHHDELIFTDARDVYLETHNLGESPKGITLRETRHISAEVSDDIEAQPSCNETELLGGLDSNQDLHRTNAFEEKSAGNYINKDSVAYSHTKEDVLNLPPKRNIKHKNSPQLWEKNCHCHSLKTYFNQKDLSQIQHTCFETDRIVSIYQCSPTQPCEILCGRDGPVSPKQHSVTQQDEIHCETHRSISLSQCPATQPQEKLCETERSISVHQYAITHLHEMLCETERSISAQEYPITHSSETICETHKSVSVHQISEPFTKSVFNGIASDKWTHPTGNAQTKRTDHDDERFDDDTHWSRRVSERNCSSRLHFIDNSQCPCWNNPTKKCIKPFPDATNGDTASADTPTFSDVREECSTVTKEDGQKKSTILTNANSPRNITRSGAESTEYSRKSLKIRAIPEEMSGDCPKECNMSDVNTCDTINSGEVRPRKKHVYKSTLPDPASFRSMIKTMMNQSEDLTSDSDNESSLISDRRKRKKLVFPVSPLQKGISNFTNKADTKSANYQTSKDVEKAAYHEGVRDKPTYAELKARALAKALPVLSKLKVQSGDYMQITPTAIEFPIASVVERTVLRTTQIHPNVNETSVNYSTGTTAELFTNDCFKTTETTSSGNFIMNESYFNRCSVFNINNSKSEQEIDNENNSTGPGQDYIRDKSTNFNTDKINLAQKDVVSVTARGKANTQPSSNAGKTNFRRKCRIPVRQNRGPRVLLDQVKIPPEKLVKKPRDVVMVLKSKNKNKGSVAAALSLIQPDESSTEDAKPITELPKHVQVFAKGNGVVVEVCADSSSTAVSVSNRKPVRAPLAERIKKYQQERPRNILAGRNRTQDNSTLGSASKRSKKISDNISSCSEVSSIASNMQVHVCEQASQSFNPRNRIDNMLEMDTSTPRSSKTFKVSIDEDAVTDTKSSQMLPGKEDGVSHEDIAVQTSNNTSASAVTVERTQLAVQKKDAAEQVSMSSSNKSNSSAKEVNENASVAQSKSLGENDSSYTEGNSKSSEKQLVSGSLTKANTYLSEGRKRYLMKNVAFRSKLPKTTSECTKNTRDNCTTCVSKHAAHTLHGRYNETLEKATKSDTANNKRQQRYKRLERPVCAQQISEIESINLLPNCQLFSPSSQESNEPSIQQDTNSTLVKQNSPYANVQNIDTHQRLSSSRNTRTINDQDDCRHHTILTSSQSYRNTTCPRLDGDEMRFDCNSDVASKNEEYRPSSSNACTDKQKHFETRSSRNFWKRDEDHLVSPECKRPHSGSALHASCHSSHCELHEIHKCNQTERAAGNETALPDTIDSSRPKQSVEYAVSQLESNIQETKDAFVSLTGTSKLNQQNCAHKEHIPDSGLTQVQQKNDGGVQREVSCKQVSIKTSETDCGGFKKSTKGKETDTHENSTLERTIGDFYNISITDCVVPIEGEATKSNRPSSSESCRVLNKELSANSSKTVQHPGYTVILPSSTNRQTENIFSPIPATMSPTTSVKHPRTRSLLLKSMVFTTEESSSKSSIKSNENGNAHVCLATRRSDSGNPLSMFGNGSPHSVADNSNLTDDICLPSRTLTCENSTAAGGEWQTDRSINSTLRIFGHDEHNHMNLPQNDSENMSGRSARIGNKTPRLSHPKNCFSACQQSPMQDRSTRTVTRLEALRTSSGFRNENWRTEKVETLNAKQLSPFLGKCDDTDKITENIFSINKQDSANKTSNTLELAPLRTDLCTRHMPTPIRHQAMTTPRKGKLTLTSLEMTDYEMLSPVFVNSYGSLSYSTTSQESAAEMYLYSTHEPVPVLADPLINSNDAQKIPHSSALSSRHKKSSRTSQELHESAKPKLPPMSPGQSGLTPLPSEPSGLPPLSSKQSGLPHRPQFRRYY